MPDNDDRPVMGSGERDLLAPSNRVEQVAVVKVCCDTTNLLRWFTVEATKRQDAPGELELVRQFINTRSLQAVTEALETPRDLDRWLREHNLVAPTDGAGRRCLDNALELREALRELTRRHNAVPLDASVLIALNRACDRARLNLRFIPDATSALQPQARDVNGGLGQLLIIVNRAMAEGIWQRLKTCPSDDCRWAFYDRSKNGIGRWCQMAECGNRAKVRNYRQRQRQLQETSPPQAAG